MKLTAQERESLLENPNVLKVTKVNIQYTPEFKLEAIDAYRSGMSANDIFKEYGFNPDMFIERYCLKSIQRWIYKLDKCGEESFFESNRGKGSTGRPKKVDVDELTVEEMKALLEIQKGVIDKLKKKHALARKK